MSTRAARMTSLLRLNEVMDEDGLRPSDWREIDAGQAKYDRAQRRRALRALWLKPVVDYVRKDGVICYRDNREDEWTLLRAARATIGLLLVRYWGDRHDKRWRRRHPKGSRYVFGLDLAYWDSLPVYGGYTVNVLQLYPGCRVTLSNDGETNL